MLYKSRTEPDELHILKLLSKRMDLSDKDKQQYINLKKGFEGELQFDSWTGKLDADCLVLNDLLLKSGNTMFQIDALVIFSEAIYVFEVKNFEGDFYFEQEKFYRLPKSEMVNPLNQLSRCETLLRQLLQEHGLLMPIVANVVFINPEFSLFQAPLNKPLILPTQLNRYWKKLNLISSKLVKKQRLIADKLISLHMIESPYKQLPSYSYDLLRKGIICKGCGSFSIVVEGKKCVCKDCGYQELVAAAVMRSVEEFRFLFPDERLTTNIIREWCRVIGSKTRIKRILEKNFEIVGVHQWAYFK